MLHALLLFWSHDPETLQRFTSESRQEAISLISAALSIIVNCRVGHYQPSLFGALYDESVVSRVHDLRYVPDAPSPTALRCVIPGYSYWRQHLHETIYVPHTNPIISHPPGVTIAYPHTPSESPASPAEPDDIEMVRSDRRRFDDDFPSGDLSDDDHSAGGIPYTIL